MTKRTIRLTKITDLAGALVKLPKYGFERDALLVQWLLRMQHRPEYSAAQCAHADDRQTSVRDLTAQALTPQEQALLVDIAVNGFVSAAAMASAS